MGKAEIYSDIICLTNNIKKHPRREIEFILINIKNKCALELHKQSEYNKQVISTQADKQILEDNNIKVKNPIVVPKVIRNIIWEQPVSSKTAIKQKSTIDLLKEFIEDESTNLSKRQIEKLNYIINRKQI